MNTRTLFVPVLLAVAVAADAQQMPWAKDFSSAKALATKSKKLIMVAFFTEW